MQGAQQQIKYLFHSPSSKGSEIIAEEHRNTKVGKWGQESVWVKYGKGVDSKKTHCKKNLKELIKIK